VINFFTDVGLRCLKDASFDWKKMSFLLLDAPSENIGMKWYFDFTGILKAILWPLGLACFVAWYSFALAANIIYALIICALFCATVVGFFVEQIAGLFIASTNSELVYNKYGNDKPNERLRTI
jgi:hypothetical protein